MIPTEVKPAAMARWPAALASFILALVALLPFLGAAPFGDPSEARYAVAAREMYLSGDWITPRINGINHFTKPPLTYWLAASSFHLCGGAGEFAARLPVVLAAAGLAALTSLIGMALFGAAGSWAGLLLCGSLPFLIMGRLLLTDLFLTFAVALFYWGLLQKPFSETDASIRSQIALAFAFFIGFMSKGPVFFIWTLLPLAISAWQRPALRLPARRAMGLPLLAGLALASPWFIAAMLRHVDLWKYFLHNQSVKTMYMAQPEFHTGAPLVFYIPALLLAGLTSFWPLMKFLGQRREWPTAAPVVGWIVWPLLLLSIIPAKHETYIFPAVPALAILAACGLSRLNHAGRWFWRVLPGFIILLFLALQWMLFSPHAAGLPSAARLRHKLAQKYLQSSVEEIGRLAGEDGTLVLVEQFTPSFFFYLRRKTPVLLAGPTIAGRFVNDEVFPQLREDRDAALEEVWADSPRPLLVFYRQQFMFFAARHPEARIAYENRRFVILTPRADLPRRRWAGDGS